jgi:hypothetical protein
MNRNVLPRLRPRVGLRTLTVNSPSPLGYRRFGKDVNLSRRTAAVISVILALAVPSAPLCSIASCDPPDRYPRGMGQTHGPAAKPPLGCHAGHGSRARPASASTRRMSCHGTPGCCCKKADVSLRAPCRCPDHAAAVGVSFDKSLPAPATVVAPASPRRPAVTSLFSHLSRGADRRELPPPLHAS